VWAVHCAMLTFEALPPTKALVSRCLGLWGGLTTFVVWSPYRRHVFEHPPPQLASRRPIWSDMTSLDTITQLREDWSSAFVVNHTIVADPTIRQPGFDLPRYTLSLMNRFRTGQGPCLLTCRSCDCGQRWTMNHIVDTCPLTKFEGGLNLLHEVGLMTQSYGWNL